MIKKTHLFILLISTIVLVSAIIAYNYIYKNHRDIKTEEASFIKTSLEIINEFSMNQSLSEKKYLNKTIEITGTITNKKPYSLTLNSKLFCQFSNQIEKEPLINSLIKIKGRFIGYDDLLEEIKLDQCIIINH